MSLPGCLLARGNYIPVYLPGIDLQNQHSGPDGLARGGIFAGTNDKTAGRSSGAEGSVGSHPLPAGLVALGSKDTIRLPVQPLYIMHRTTGCEIVDHQDTIFNSEA